MNSYHQILNADFALRVAAAHGNLQEVMSLLDQGVNVCAPNKENETAIGLAAENGHVETVKYLLNFPHSKSVLRDTMANRFAEALICTDTEKRNRLFEIAELIKQKLDARSKKEKILGLEEGNCLSFNNACHSLFSRGAKTSDINPRDKDSAIRNALIRIYSALQKPDFFIPFVKFLNEELEYHWNLENDQPFKPFDKNMIDYWSHEGILWPMPNEKYQGIKKNHLLNRVLLAKFKKYEMGDHCSKWTGYIPMKQSMNLLSNNAFFTENRRTMNGLLHGNMHTVQRVLLLLAIESLDIPINYYDDKGCEQELKPKDIFSALMRKDICPIKPKVLWSDVLDLDENEFATFTNPFKMHSLLMTEVKFSGMLQDYLLYSFCDQFIRLRDLHNHIYKINLDNKGMCNEIQKIQKRLFSGIFEFAIQMNEGKNLKEVSTIDTLPEKPRRWDIQEKNYLPLKNPVREYWEDADSFLASIFEPEENIISETSKKRKFDSI